uniref:Uncharacterized protein n=1 Tax=Anguilla anguilla TaxID=7936 RepID=A0A0E9WEW5_ANGAN
MTKHTDVSFSIITCPYLALSDHKNKMCAVRKNNLGARLLNKGVGNTVS